MKTLAIRLEDELHAQLSLIAQLESQTITDAIRAAVLTYVESRKASLSNHAEAALAEIEREATARRQAITALFGGGTASTTAPVTPPVEDGPEPTTRPSRSKGGSASS